MDDRALVSLVINGDLQAFKELIQRHERLVAHMVGRLVRHPEDREEICQDVFMRVYEKISDFNFKSRLSTWVATIAYRHAINYLRKRKLLMMDVDSFDLGRQFVSDDDPEKTVAEEDIEQIILKLVDYMTVQYKAILTLYHVEGRNYAEIGEITGMPEGTVKNYLFRARQMLKEKVKKYLGAEQAWK